jgi:ribosomal protein S10
MNRKLIIDNKMFIINLKLESFSNILLNKILLEKKKRNLTFLPHKIKKYKVIRSPHVNKKSMESFNIKKIKINISMDIRFIMEDWIIKLIYFSKKFLFEYFNIIIKNKIFYIIIKTFHNKNFIKFYMG